METDWLTHFLDEQGDMLAEEMDTGMPLSVRSRDTKSATILVEPLTTVPTCAATITAVTVHGKAHDATAKFAGEGTAKPVLELAVDHSSCVPAGAAWVKSVQPPKRRVGKAPPVRKPAVALPLAATSGGGESPLAGRARHAKAGIAPCEHSKTGAVALSRVGRSNANAIKSTCSEVEVPPADDVFSSGGTTPLLEKHLRTRLSRKRSALESDHFSSSESMAMSVEPEDEDLSTSGDTAIHIAIDTAIGTAIGVDADVAPTDAAPTNARERKVLRRNLPPRLSWYALPTSPPLVTYTCHRSSATTSPSAGASTGSTSASRRYAPANPSSLATAIAVASPLHRRPHRNPTATHIPPSRRVTRILMRVLSDGLAQLYDELALQSAPLAGESSFTTFDEGEPLGVHGADGCARRSQSSNLTLAPIPLSILQPHARSHPTLDPRDLTFAPTHAAHLACSPRGRSIATAFRSKPINPDKWSKADVLEGARNMLIDLRRQLEEERLARTLGVPIGESVAVPADLLADTPSRLPSLSGL